MVLIGLLLINGYFQIQRTRSQLFTILENEALLVIKSLEKNSGNSLASLSLDHPTWSGAGEVVGSEVSLSVEELLIESLITIALQIDQEAAQKTFNPQTLKEKMDSLGLKDIRVLKSVKDDHPKALLPGPLKTRSPFYVPVLEGKSRLAVFRGEGPVRQTLPLAIAVGRRFEKGAVLILLSPEEYLRWGSQLIIQGFLEDFSGKGNISYLRIEGPGEKVMALTGQGERREKVPSPLRKEVRSGDPGLIWIRTPDTEFLEVVRPFKPAGKDMGLVRLGLSLKEVNPILDQSRRYTFIMSLVLLGLGMISIFFIFRLQGRHFQKIQEMGKQIRLKEEQSAMGQLAAGVAHEIKNPLNAISLVVQRLQQEFVWEKKETQKEYERFTRIVRDEIARVNEIIGHFLMVAKPLALRLDDHSIPEILNYVSEVMEEEFRQKGIRVFKEWGREIPTVRCDRFQLTQAFLNIFRNALEAMPDGGELHLGVKRVSRFKVQGSSFSKSETRNLKPEPLDGIEISVRDTGKGIPPEESKKIFAHYYTTKEKGVGLGLAITQKIVQVHGGFLEVQSLVNQGTTVTIRLPGMKKDFNYTLDF